MMHQNNNVNNQSKVKALSVILLQIVIVLILFFLSLKSNAQARMVMSNDIWLTMDKGIFLTIDNTNTNAITTTGTGGNILSEDEDNKLKWIMSTATGIYVVPFSDTNSTLGNVKMPVTVNITGAATGNDGSINFSTYETLNGAFGYENTPWPSMVTTFNHNLTDNSPYAIDRFWLIDADNYITKPTVTISLTYPDDEHAAPNTITEANLKAQRFDDNTGEWNTGGNKIFGTANTTLNTVSGIAISPSDFFTAWTLVDLTSPLPVKLTSFSSNCNNGEVELSWQTATEINNDYFSVERSFDGVDFLEIAQIIGNGNSNQTINYNFIDRENDGIAYYRLKQVDFNGQFEYSNTIFAECKNQISGITVSPNPSSGMFTIGFNQKSLSATCLVSNALGEVILKKTVSNQNKIQLNLTSYPKGIYYLTVINGSAKKVKKLVKF